jgi:hypothetical protein
VKAGSNKPRAPEIPYELVKKVGGWCCTPEGRRELEKEGLGELAPLLAIHGTIIVGTRPYLAASH